MRWVLAPVLALLATTGCLQATFDGARGVAPVVLMEMSFEVIGTGSAEGAFARPCEMVRYSRDPEHVTLVQGAFPDGVRPDFVVLQELGQSWRAANRTAPDGHTLSVSYGGSGGGFLPWIRGPSSSALGMGTPFRWAPDGHYVVAWDGHNAIFRGTVLEEDVPVMATIEYDLPNGEGGTLQVRETVRVTFLGRVPVTVEEGVCEGRVLT